MRLKNRKRYFTQWDKGQILIVDECPEGTQIHFTNTKSELAYVLETDENLEVEVPDVLPYPVTAWVYRINGTNYYTESRREFQVIKRARPESYIYTPEEQHYWETKVDKTWGAENYGKFLIVGEDGDVTLSEMREFNINDKFLVYNRTVPSNEWVINHNLEKYPSVTVVDSANSIITGEVTYIDMNNLKITFQAAFSGRAYLN